MNTSDWEKDGRHVVVAGFGLVGRAVADQLEAAGLDVTIIETNSLTVATQTQRGKSIVFGDVCDPQVLRNADITDARALILTIPDDNDALRACQVARQLAPHIFIAARTSFVSKGLLATRAGADHVVIEELVTAEAMQRAVLEHLEDES